MSLRCGKGEAEEKQQLFMSLRCGNVEVEE